MSLYYQDEHVTLYHGDCREIIPALPSVEAVLTDPPYGITDSSWDNKFDAQWLVESLTESAPEGVAAFAAVQPLTAELVLAAGKRFRHEWIWQKNAGSNFGTLKWHPMREHESVIVTAKSKGRYFPVMQERSGGGLSRVKSGAVNYSASKREGVQNGALDKGGSSRRPDLRYPSSIQKFNRERGLHPTQKPVDLFAYLVETYTRTGDTVLDPFAGSGTTLVAALSKNRKAIGVELEERYCEIIARRLDQGVLDFSSLA